MANRPNSKSTALKLLRYLPLALVAIFAAAFLLSGSEVSVEAVLGYTPEAPVLAALVLIAIYAVKSLTIFFPTAVLFAAGGFLFDWPVAIAVNLAGMAVATSIPYFIGRCSGSAAASRLLEKYPKLSVLQKVRSGSDMLFVFQIRVLGVLPCDPVSMYCGAVGVPFAKHLAGSLLGFFPSLTLITLLGESITDPSSPQFIILLASTAAISAVSITLYIILLRRKLGRGGKEQ